MKKFLMVLGVAALAACSTTQEAKAPDPIKRQVVLDEKEYAPYDVKGTAVIEGRLCTKNAEGKEVCPAGQRVILNPVTTYSKEWFEAWKTMKCLEPPHPTALKHNRLTATDEKGNFKFDNLAPGKYFVAAEICVPCGKKDEKDVKDSSLPFGRFAAEVTVQKQSKVVLKKVFPAEPAPAKPAPVKKEAPKAGAEVKK